MCHRPHIRRPSESNSTPTHSPLPVSLDMPNVEVPARQIRAVQTDASLTVYQAYSPEIAKPALDAGRFVPPFKSGRMTWIKPSFLWMAYRCGWATKEGQEHVLAVVISKAGFETALANSSLSHYEPGTYASHQEWQQRKDNTSVRIQWDPERNLHLQPLAHRSIQVGLSGDASRHYVDDWILRISDVTDLVKEVQGLVNANKLDEAHERLPVETPYQVPDGLAAVIGSSSL